MVASVEPSSSPCISQARSLQVYHPVAICLSAPFYLSSVQCSFGSIISQKARSSTVKYPLLVVPLGSSMAFLMASSINRYSHLLALDPAPYQALQSHSSNEIDTQSFIVR